MLKVTLIGAGGKMGLRLTHNLRNSVYDMAYAEISTAAIEKLKEKGVRHSEAGESIPSADVVILAVPDVALEKVSSEVIPLMKSGSLVVTLDPAAALAGKLFYRSDVGCFITHPTHPSIFNWEPVEDNMKDHFGGVRQSNPLFVH
jgi:D-apionate oxidoisomerase